jgi:Flp pilus assembly protein TadG
MKSAFRPRDERGAVLVHAAVLLLALTAFSALVFDLGVMYVSRGQAQNAADAGALAAATSLAFVDSTNQTLASNSAINMAQQNLVWGEAPGIGSADVAFSPVARCPPTPSGLTTCVRVNVYRTSYQGGGGTPLPTFFANIVGVGEQGTRATATAQVLASPGTADCVKPWALPDIWRPPSPQFGAGSIYQPPIGNDPGSGYQLPRDQGAALTLTLGVPNDVPRPSSYYPFMTGLLPYQDAIESCSDGNVTPGMILVPDSSGMAANPATTIAGVNTLISLDPAATWNPAANGGLGAPSGGCMTDGSCVRSARLVAIPLFDPAEYFAGLPSAPTLRVTKILGLWLESVAGATVIAYLTPYPTVSLTGPIYPEPASFARTVVLIR